MPTHTSLKDLRSRILTIILAEKPPGCTIPDDQIALKMDDMFDTLRREESFGDLYLNWNSAWTVDCSLTIKLQKGKRVSSGYAALQCSCLVNWPSTRRTIVEAVAAVNLYQRIISLAALIEAVGNVTILPEEKAKS